MVSIAAEPIFHIGSFPVTNTLLVTGIVSGSLIAIAARVKLTLKQVPGARSLQNAVEAVIEGLLDFFTSVTQDREKAKQFFPFVATIFLFVILANWIELLPGVGTIGMWATHEGKQEIVPFLRSASTDLNATLAIAVTSVIATQFFGIAVLGFAKHVGKYISFKGPIEFFVGILELVAEIAKVFSFSFRLFGNIFAGEILLTVVLVLMPFFAPLPFLLLEFFVGFIQALVFSMLTLVFMTLATAEHH